MNRYYDPFSDDRDESAPTQNAAGMFDEFEVDSPAAGMFSEFGVKGDEDVGYLERMGKRIFSYWPEAVGGQLTGAARELKSDKNLVDRYRETTQEHFAPPPDDMGWIERARHSIDAPYTMAGTGRLLSDLISDTMVEGAQEIAKRHTDHEALARDMEGVGQNMFDRGQRIRDEVGEFNIRRPDGFEPGQFFKYYGTQALESLGGHMGPAIAIGMLTRGRVKELNRHRQDAGLPPVSEAVAGQVGALGTMAATVWGSEYERSYRKSGDHDAAVDEANMRMFAEVVPEIVPFGFAMRSIGPEIFGKWVKQLGGIERAALTVSGTGVSGAASETLTEIIHEAYDVAELGKEMDFEDFKTRMFDAAMVGTLMGVTMSLPAATAEGMQPPRDRLDDWADQFNRDYPGEDGGAQDPHAATEANPAGGGFDMLTGGQVNKLTHDERRLEAPDNVMYGGIRGEAPSPTRPPFVDESVRVPPTGPGFEQQTQAPPLRLDQKPSYIEGPDGQRLEPLDLEGAPILPREEGFEPFDPAPALPELDTTNFGEFESDEQVEAYLEEVGAPMRKEIETLRKQSEGNLLKIIATRLGGLNMDAWKSEHGLDVKGMREKGGLNWLAGFGHQLFTRQPESKTPDQLAEALNEIWETDPLGIGPEYFEKTPDGRMVLTGRSVGELLDDAVRDPDRFGDQNHIRARSKEQELLNFEGEMIMGWEEYRDRRKFNEQFKNADPELFADMEQEATHEKPFYNEQWNAESRALADWYSEAEEAGVDPAELDRLAATARNPADQVRKIFALIEARNEQRAEPEATDAPRDPGPRPAEAEGRVPAETQRPQEPEPAGTRQDQALTAPLYIEWMGRQMPVESVDDARRKWVEFRDNSEAGVSQIGNGLDVFNADGSKLGRISYNGRWWPEEGADLLGQDTRKAQALTDRRREKEESRSGRADQDTVPVEAGAGDLFSGAAKQQDFITGTDGFGTPPQPAEKDSQDATPTKNHAVDSKGEPVVVYRGEHGQSDTTFQTRSGSLTFTDSEKAAKKYAYSPNDQRDTPVNPRVHRATLEIFNPVINTPEDPFIEGKQLREALGLERTIEILIANSEAIYNTNNWSEVNAGIETVQELLDRYPTASVVDKLYFEAFYALDDAGVVADLKAAGYDGAIYGGSGETAGSTEYRVFSESQAKLLGAQDEIDTAANQAATSPTNNLKQPTKAQQENGNYKKGHLSLHGLNITVENPKGSMRRGDGWQVRMKDHYGYIKRTEGADGEHVDVFLGPNARDKNPTVAIVDQRAKDGSFDEHKVIIGYEPGKAEQTYARNYSPGYIKNANVLAALSEVSLDELKGWLKSGDLTVPYSDETFAKETENERQQESDEPQGRSVDRVPREKAGPERERQEPGGQRLRGTDGLESQDGSVDQPERSEGLGAIAKRYLEATGDRGDVYVLSGSRNAKLRQSLMAELLGRKVTQAESGINALRKALNEAFGVEGKTPREREEVLARKMREAVGAKAPAEPKAPAKKDAGSEKIDDFGETIEGAAKHYAAAYLDKLRETGEAEIASRPLSKAWPLPDYQKLLDEGVEPWTVAFIRAARDEIPPKPRKSWKVAGYVKQVMTLRSFADSLLSGDISPAKVREEIAKRDILKNMMSRVDLYLEVGHDKSLKGVTVRQGKYSIKDGVKYDPPKLIWTVEKKAKATAFSNWPRQLAEGATREEAIANFKKAVKSGKLDEKGTKRKVRFNIYSERGKSGVLYIGKKIGRHVVKLKEFSSLTEAREYLQENQKELESLLAKYKNIPSMRREKNSPRVGIDHRNGGDVTPEQFHETFGFRGVQFGNYVEQGKRQDDLNNAYDSLMDMAGMLDIPPKALSLNGELGLAFGARGKGGKNAAAAHYERGHVVINLTKKRGAGSLAHEWWHSLDNYFSRMGGAKSGYMTEARTSNFEGVRKEMLDAFRGVAQAVTSSGIRQRSMKLDQREAKPYWSTGREMTARAFESFVVAKLTDQGVSNDYLANIVSKEYWEAAAALGMEMEGTYPYPEAAELPQIRAAFDHFFETIEAKETDEGTIMLREDGGVYSPHERAKGSVQTEEKRGRATDTAQLALDLPAAPSVSAQRAQLEANFNTHYRRTPTRKIRVGLEKVTTPEEAAHVLAPLRKLGQEVFYALVLDGDGNILDLQYHHKGTKDAATVSLDVVVPAIAAVPGSKHVYFAHNHPTGDPTPSVPDHGITKRLIKALDGVGVTVSHIVLGRHGKAALIEQGDSFFDTPQLIDIKPLVRKRTVEVTEKTVRRIPPQYRPNFGNPDEARAILRRRVDSDNALVLFDTRHGLIGTLAIAPEEMSALRQGDLVRRILTAIDQTNAVNVLVKTTSKSAGKNVGRFLTNAGVYVTDIFVNGESMTLTGNVREEGPWFSRDGLDLGFEKTESKAGPGQVTFLTKQLEAAMRLYFKIKLEPGSFTQVKTPKRHRTAVKAIERVFGLRSAFVHGKGDAGRMFNGVLVPGDTKTAYININATNPFMGVVGHELLHSLARRYPEIYNRLAEIALEHVKRDGIERYAKKLRKLQKEREPEYTRGGVFEEMVADVTGEAFLDPKFIDSVLKKAGVSFVKRMWEAIKNILDSILRRITNKNMGASKYFNDVKALKKRVQELLDGLDLSQESQESQSQTPSFSREAEADTFYSQLVETVEKAEGMPKKGKPEAFKQWLDGQQRKGNLKQEERDWMGVDEWLDAQDTVTRDQLQEFVRVNQVQVEETLLGGLKLNHEDAVEELMAELDEWVEREGIDYQDQGHVELLERDDLTSEQRHYLESFDQRMGIANNHSVSLPPGYSWARRAGGWGVIDESGEAIAGLHGDINEAMAAWVNQVKAENERSGFAGAPQYEGEDFNLPGGREYRELLLTLPVQAGNSRGWQDYRDELQHRGVSARDADEVRRWGVGAPQEGIDMDAVNRIETMMGSEWMNRYRDVLQDKERRPVRENVFKSTHFNRPNILAHVRFDVRTDADGNRVLFIEEIQSDWHQKGRKKGYATSDRAGQEARKVEGRWQVYDQHGVFVTGISTDIAKTEAEAIKEANRRLREGGIGDVSLDGRVPDAPFKKSWPMLAMKRMIRWAAENGYDAIAWTTGEQQTERYNLRKYLESVHYLKRDDGAYYLTGTTIQGGHHEFGDKIPAEKLPDYVGKDLAEKIVAGKGERDMGDLTVLRGVDLEVGGEGMVGFYDKILPREVAKYVKKWGATVGETQIPAAIKATQVRVASDGNRYWLEATQELADVADDPRVSDYFDSAAKAMEARDAMGAGLVPVHSVTLTDPMRDAATQGQPMFNRMGPQRAARTFREWLGDIGKIYTRRAERWVDLWNAHIGASYDVLGRLPRRDDYLIRRYETLGQIGATERLTKRVYEALEKASEADKQAVFDFLTTAGAMPNSITNPAVRNNAVRIKRMIDTVGQRLVDAGLLSQEAYEEHKDAYLPRLYLKHLLDDKAFHALGAGKHVSGLGYLKKRKDIPSEVRAVILGEVTDPGFLASVGIGRAMRDMAILDFLDDISGNEDWIHPRGLVEWGGRRVTVFWLHDEANRLRNQARHMKAGPAQAARELADRMQDAVDAVKEETGKDVSDYRQIPLTPQYGRLRGMWVRKEIYDDVRGVSGYTKADHSFFESLLGFGGIGTKATQWWKLSKVALNPPTQIRNVVSNLVLLHLSGVPAHRIPDLLVKAVKQIRNDGPAWKIAKKYGISQSTFSNNELAQVHRALTSVRMDMASTPQQRAALQLRSMFEALAEIGGDVYQLMEGIGKVAKILHETEKGTSPARAALEAHKALFDYSLVPRTVMYLRNVPYGMPFITFYYKALPRMLEVAVKYPWRFSPYVALPYIVAQMMAQMFDVDEEDWKKLRKAFPEWLSERKHAYVVPWKDQHGRWVVFDLSYFLPWVAYFDVARAVGKGDVGEGFRDTGLFSGPIVDLITALRTNVDPFTKREIVDELDPPKKKMLTLLGYVWTMAMPTFLTEHGAAGKLWQAMALDDGASLDEELRPRHTVSMAMLRLLGVNTYAIDPEMSRFENLRRMRYEITQVKRRMTRELSAPNLSREKAERIELRYRLEIDRRIEQLIDYEEASEVHPRLRTGWEPSDEEPEPVIGPGGKKLEPLDLEREEGGRQ